MFKPEEIIISLKLNHNQVYNFKLHRAKLELRKAELPYHKFEMLKKYLEFVQSDKFPYHIFNINEEDFERRASN